MVVMETKEQSFPPFVITLQRQMDGAAFPWSASGSRRLIATIIMAVPIVAVTMMLMAQALATDYCIASSIFDPDVSYHQPRPEWEGHCRSGSLQSPIDIPRQGNVMVDYDDLLLDNYYSSPQLMRLINTGHSLMMSLGHCSRSHLDADRWPQISGGGLNGTYVFDQLHIRWGPNYQGSEHLKSGTRFPLEAQLIHYNSQYGSMEAASSYPDGIAILASLFQMTVDLNPKLDMLLDFLPNVTEPDQWVDIDIQFPLDYLLPKNKKLFFRYYGSLTAPPCTENVIWTVFKLPIPITLKHLSSFDYIFGHDARTKERYHLLTNSRSLQSRNERVIYQNDGAISDPAAPVTILLPESSCSAISPPTVAFPALLAIIIHLTSLTNGD